MEYRQLGKSELKISQIGYGCMSLKSDEKENIRLLQAAADNGINYFDTADIYDKGENERLVGKAFTQNRDKVIIATKVGNVWKEDGSGLEWNASKDHILKSVDESLSRLQTDYIDLYQLHGGTREDNIGQVIDAFEMLQMQGKIRYYGISSIRPNVIRQYVSRSTFDSLMIQYNLLDRRPEEIVLPLMEEEKIGVVVRGSLASGLLVNKPAKSYLDYTEEQVAALQSAIKATQIDPTSLAIQYVLHNPAVTSSIVGIRTQQQLDEALKSLETPAISPETWENLTSVLPALTYQLHR